MAVIPLMLVMEEIMWSMNPWWTNALVPEKLHGFERRKYLDPLEKVLGKKVVIVMGPRRSGKTTLMMQLISGLLKRGISTEKILYTEMDHPLIGSIDDVVRKFREIHGIRRKDEIYLFLDEIQHVDDWGRWVKALYDIENVNIVVSGSSTTILRPEVATYLTGRNHRIDVWPLSFSEYVDFRGKPERDESYMYSRYLEDYMVTGGYPEAVLERDPILRNMFLRSYFEDMIDRDVVRVYGVREVNALRELAAHVIENTAQVLSLNKLSKVLKVPLSSLSKYMSFLESAYLFFAVEYHSDSINERRYNPKKYYTIDTGLKHALTGKKNLGALAENVLYLHLHRRYRDVYYWKSTHEVDFILNKGQKVIECKYHDQIDRGILKGIGRFIENNNPKSAIIISRSLEDKIEVNGRIIDIIPLWKYLMRLG